MNYNNYDTCTNIPCPESNLCTQAPLPEATLSDIVRNNTVDINNIKYVLENIYRHLYGNPEEKTGPCNEKPECLRDELLDQSHNLTAINEKLARICSKLGM